MTEFNADSTTSEVIAGVSLADKVAVVAVASAGLGVETARVLAQAGDGGLLVARDPGKLEPVLQTLQEQVPDAQPAVAGKSGVVEPHATDPVLAEQLWTLSENLVSQSF